MSTLLTVDWDYFVPEDPMFDLAHRECLAYLDMIWKARACLLDKIVTTGAEKGFWKAIGASAADNGVTYVSDSHLFAYKLLRGIDHVLLVDAHHDCWPRATPKAVECSDWLRVWLKGSKKRRATWVCPDWSKDRFELPDDLKGQVTVVHTVEPWKVDRVHVCRSGCWTPPWLDKQFIEFVEARGGRMLPLQFGEWDPIKERWTAEDMKVIRANEATIREVLGSMATGTISSSSFVNAKVELAATA